MSSGRPRPDQGQTSTCPENLLDLLSHRSLDEMLSEALSLLVCHHQAIGGSLLYLSTPPKRFYDGRLGSALDRIQSWEDSVLTKLRARQWETGLPRIVPVTWASLPDCRDKLLLAPMIGSDRVSGAVGLILPYSAQRAARTEQELSQWVAVIANIAVRAEQLSLTRRHLSRLGLFYQMEQAMTHTFDLDRLYQEITETTLAVIDAQAVQLMLYDHERGELVQRLSLGGSRFPGATRVPLGHGIIGAVAERRQPVLLNDVSKDTQFDPVIDGCQEFPVRSLLCVPVQIRGQLIGTLQVLNKVDRAGFDEQDLSILIAMAAQASIAVENARLYEELRTERDRIIQAQEDTRRELARNLHDGPVQQLSALAMRLEWLERLAKAQPEDVPQELAALRESARRAAQAARMLLFEIRPVILETQGLVPALQSYTDRLSESSRLKLHFDSGGLEPGLDTEVASTVFSIVQEAVTNAEKHAHAQNVRLGLRQTDSHLIVTIEDDGLGFDVASVESQYDRGNSLGLLNMRERAELIGGVLTLESGPTRGKPGTLIQLRLALPTAEESRDG